MPGRMYRRTSTGNGTNTISATRNAFTNARREGRPGSAIAQARTYAAENSGAERPQDERLDGDAAVEARQVDADEDESERDDAPEALAVEADRLRDELADRALARRQRLRQRLSRPRIRQPGHGTGGYRPRA